MVWILDLYKKRGFFSFLAHWASWELIRLCRSEFLFTILPLSAKTIQLFQIEIPFKSVPGPFLVHSFWGLPSWALLMKMHRMHQKFNSLVKLKFEKFFWDKSQLACVPFNGVHRRKAAHSRNFSQRNVRWWISFTLLLGVFGFYFALPLRLLPLNLLFGLFRRTIFTHYRIFSKYNKISKWAQNVIYNHTTSHINVWYISFTILYTHTHTYIQNTHIYNELYSCLFI